MTNFLLPILLGLIALAYIFMPLLVGASDTKFRPVNYVPGVEELDLDHDLGKIDDEEWTQRRRAMLEQTERSSQLPPTNIERLIYNFRRARRTEISAEAEILIARNRKKSEK